MINWFTGKKTLEIIIIILFTVSIWAFISSSTENLVLNYLFIEYLFVNQLTGNSLYFNLSLGFIVSSIFYFLVSYLPERRRQNNLKPIVKDKLEEVLSKLNSLFTTITEYSSIDIKLESLNEDNFNKVCSNFEIKKDLNAGQLGSCEYPIEGKYYSSTPGVILLNNYFQFIEKMNNLKEIIHIYNDPELTAIFYEFDEKPISKVMRTIITSTEKNLTIYESLLIHIFKIRNKLLVYNRKYINKDYDFYDTDN